MSNLSHGGNNVNSDYGFALSCRGALPEKMTGAEEAAEKDTRSESGWNPKQRELFSETAAAGEA